MSFTIRRTSVFTAPVRRRRLLIAKGTMDERVVNIVLKEKEAGQDKLLEALRAEIMEAA